MAQSTQIQRPGGLRTAVILSLAMAIGVLPAQRAHALIEGGRGNSPIADPGWPQGAARIFNDPSRIAWWVGPPFGGGQWHAECRGNTRVLKSVLDDLASLDVKTKRVVLHDGVGRSVWLNPNRDPAKRAAAEMDWTFVVWQRNSWERVRKMPADLRPPDVRDADKDPPAQIDVYCGGKVRWSDVLVPAGLEIIDERLQAHGFATADGNVLEGKVLDSATRKSVAARVRLERIESQPRSYCYTKVSETVADNQGRWFLKKAPEGWYRLVVQAEGYVPRVVGYAKLDDQPGWHPYDCGLARATSISGRITDEAGKPLTEVLVQLRDIVTEGNDGYKSPNESVCKTDADGRFHSDQVPVGKARIWLRKAGYLHPGLGPTISMPAKDVELRMERSAQVHVTVDFAGKKRPEAYLVEIEAEGGRAVGKWGGAGNIDQKNQIVYADVPPGRYVIQGHPNPYSTTRHEQTTPITIDLKTGQSAEVTLSAK
ncbi:MAG TPA: carboxypeptidase-like regulatory domain-containing protein [Planctomycetaceae bacterium]|nr:carboxypeptidase-like regulatory domain-containing protein [Planctomycetaceae bacterium]